MSAIDTTVGDSFAKDDPRHMERVADKDLLAKVEEWPNRERREPSRKRVAWVSLISPPGQGNTSLLHHLTSEQLLSADLAKLRRIFIGEQSSEADRGPDVRFPFATSFARELLKSRSTLWQRVRLYFRRDKLRSTLLGCVVAATWLVISIAVVAATAGALRSLTELVTYLRTNVISVVVKILGGALLTLCTGWLAFFFGKQESSQERLGDEEEAKLHTLPGLTQALAELCLGHEWLLLVVDDADSLPHDERLFLFSIVQDGVKRNTSLIPVLIVALESSEQWKASLAPLGIRYDTVKPDLLSRSELREIALRHPDGAVTSETELEELVDAAIEGGVKALFRGSDYRGIFLAGGKFDELRAASPPDQFHYAEALSYLAAARKFSIEKKELAAIFKDPLLKEHLNECGYQGLVEHADLWVSKHKAAASRVVRGQDTRVIFFDVVRCDAWCRFLEDRDPLLLQQAHYFWCRRNRQQALGAAANAEKPVLNAAWHAREASRVTAEPGKSQSGPRSMVDQLAISAGAKVQRAIEVFNLLLQACTIFRLRGESDRATSYASVAADWVIQVDSQAELLGNVLWENYWEHGEANVQHALQALALRFPQLKTSPWWSAHCDRHCYVSGRKDPAGATLVLNFADAELRNAHLLAGTLLLLRRTHGFRHDALADSSVSWPLPSESPEPMRAELPLLDLTIEALILRHDDQLGSVLAQYRRALERVRAASTHSGGVVPLEYHTARYWGHLVSALARRCEVDDAGKAEALVRNAAFEQLPSNVSLERHLVKGALAAYDRANRLALLLDSRPLLSAICFHQGVFLKNFGERTSGENDAPWWDSWDQLFTQCVGLEREMGWLVYSPAIHHARWLFFKDLDRPAALTDAYNTLADTFRAHYPKHIRLGVLSKVAEFLNNYGANLYEPNRRAAVLLEFYASRLSSRDENAERWLESHDLRIERAYCLCFAAQCWRRANQLARARRALDRCVSLINAVKCTLEDQKHLHRVRVLWSIQRADLYQTQESSSEYRAAIRQTWTLLSRDDREYALLLQRLVGIEEEEDTLQSPWPEPGTPVQVDPLNPALSIPEEFFGGLEPQQIQTRLDFRIHQLAAVIFDNVSVLPVGKPAEVAEQWTKYDQLGTTVLWLAREAKKGEVSSEVGQLLTALLWRTWYYFSTIENLAALELDTLALLMEFEPESDSIREIHERVVRQSRDLLVHELRLLEQDEDRDWASTAEIFRRRFRPAINQERFRAHVEQAMIAAGVSPEEREARVLGLEQARREFAAGHLEACLRTLTPVLPPRDSTVARYEDILVLDLWVRCELLLMQATPREREDRAAQRRSAALQYCRLLAQSLDSEELQSLATGLLDDLERVESLQEKSNQGRTETAVGLDLTNRRSPRY